MENVIELDHPLVRHHIARLRDVNTDPETFRNLARRLTTLLAYEATKDLETVSVEIQTPIARAAGQRLKNRIGLIPILRAGLGMVDPVLDLLPEAEVWHLGFYRDEQTLKPVEYYKKFPAADPVHKALVLDPMLATGGSAVAALQSVADWGVEALRLLVMIAAPEGIRRVHDAFPQTRIYVCAIDERLNDQAYIVPGLGDAGDRIFNACAT